MVTFGDGVVECDGGDGEGFAVFDLKARLKTASGSAANWGGMSRQKEEMVKFVNTYLQAQIKGRRKKRIFYGQADHKGGVEGGGV